MVVFGIGCMYVARMWMGDFSRKGLGCGWTPLLLVQLAVVVVGVVVGVVVVVVVVDKHANVYMYSYCFPVYPATPRLQRRCDGRHAVCD